jgi:TatD DNase family protein
LLVETDAPDMPVPPGLDRHRMSDSAEGRVNHPANLIVAYEGLAALRGMPLEELAGIVSENYARLFGG